MTDQPTAVTKPISEWIAQLSDPKTGRREAAAGCLGGLEDPAAVEPLVALLARESNENVRLAVVRALKAIGDARAAAPLAAHLAAESGAAVRQAILFALGHLRQPESIPLLAKELVDEPDYEVRYGAVDALSHYSDPAAAQALVKALDARLSENLRGRIVTALGVMKAGAGAAAVEQALLTDREENVRRAAAKSLALIRGGEAVQPLNAALAKERDPKVVLRIIEQLGELGAAGADAETVSGALIAALLDARQPELRAALKTALARVPGWQVKLKRLSEILQGGAYERENIPAREVVEALGVPPAELQKDPALLTNEFLRLAVDSEKDKRLTNIYACLVTASTGDNLEEAGERINAYQKAHSLAAARLDGLRIRVGGETALDPVLQMLSDDLRLYFREPIRLLNDVTSANWQQTIRSAHFGFMARMILSLIVFAVGILLLVVSAYRFMFVKLDVGQMFGSGVSFISGLGTLLLVIYTGPLKEIRSAVNDLGTASAAFIAYIHRVLQISHTYSFYYLKQTISFEEMVKSSKLIEDAMNDTIIRLNTLPGKASEDVLRKALAQLNKEKP